MVYYEKLIFGYHTWKKNQLQMFPLTADVDPDGEVTSDSIINNHLIILKEKNYKIFSIFAC